MEVDLRVSIEGHYERLLIMMRTVVWLDYWKNRELEKHAEEKPKGGGDLCEEVSEER